MRLFIYEWITGGGLLAHSGSLPESLLTEGLAMVQAVAEDFSAAGLQVTLLRDLRVDGLSARGGEINTVSSQGEHEEAFERLCREADAVLLVAPEIDGALTAVVKHAEAVGGRLISPGAGFVKVASDKHRTAERLRAAGVPTPHGVVLDSEASLSVDFPYPAVIKPLDGAGSQDIYVVSGPHDSPPAYVADRRLEELVPGIAASCAVLTGPKGATPLPPCRQRLSTDGRLRYLGGSTPLARGLAERAEQLALRALDALPPTQGYVGVDLVLGAAPDGSGDRVIEINPRLTTSYTGLRFAVKPNLALAMLAAARGEGSSIEVDDRPLEFGVDGAVSYTD